MDVLLIVLLTLCNAVFAMSEMALAASRKARLQALKEAQVRGAGAALQLLQEPTQFLSTVQVGMTLVVLINGLVGEAAFRAPLARDLMLMGMHAHAAMVLAAAIVVAIITFVTIVFGELVPKRIGQLYPETTACWVAQPMIWLASAAKPFVALLALTTRGVLNLLRVDLSKARTVTQAEISASLEEGVDAGLIEAQEHQMVRNVFHLDGRPLTSLMTPRGDIEWLDASITVPAALQYVSDRGEKSAHSHYPVCRGSLDEVMGIISIARLLELSAKTSDSLETLVSPAAFVPETLSGLEILQQLRQRTGVMVFVVDEYGSVQGLMTPHDLLEAITGELKLGEQLDAWATPGADGTWILDGRMPVSELKTRLQIKDLPQEGKGLYNTLAGLLLACTGHLPQVGEQIVCASWIFQIVTMDQRRIDRILAFPVDENTHKQNRFL